jgi:hypothetical protein
MPRCALHDGVKSEIVRIKNSRGILPFLLFRGTRNLCLSGDTLFTMPHLSRRLFDNFSSKNRFSWIGYYVNKKGIVSHNSNFFIVCYISFSELRYFPPKVGQALHSVWQRSTTLFAIPRYEESLSM